MRCQIRAKGEVRRQIEARLASGALRAVIATNALELGIDIGELDCAVVVGFPGSVASLRQEWGRAGRRQRGLGLLVLGDDALDQWFARHPEALMARPVEAIALDPNNPEIRIAHLACAAELGVDVTTAAFKAELKAVGDAAHAAALGIVE